MTDFSRHIERLGVTLPLVPHATAPCVVVDATGRMVLSIETPSCIGDEEAAAIAKLVAEAVNGRGGYFAPRTSNKMDAFCESSRLVEEVKSKVDRRLFFTEVGIATLVFAAVWMPIAWWLGPTAVLATAVFLAAFAICAIVVTAIEPHAPGWLRRAIDWWSKSNIPGVIVTGAMVLAGLAAASLVCVAMALIILELGGLLA